MASLSEITPHATKVVRAHPIATFFLAALTVGGPYGLFELKASLQRQREAYNVDTQRAAEIDHDSRVIVNYAGYLRDGLPLTASDTAEYETAMADIVRAEKFSPRGPFLTMKLNIAEYELKELGLR